MNRDELLALIGQAERHYAEVYHLLYSCGITTMRMNILERVGRDLDRLYAEYDKMEAGDAHSN